MVRAARLARRRPRRPRGPGGARRPVRRGPCLRLCALRGGLRTSTGRGHAARRPGGGERARAECLDESGCPADRPVGGPLRYLGHRCRPGAGYDRRRAPRRPGHCRHGRRDPPHVAGRGRGPCALWTSLARGEWSANRRCGSRSDVTAVPRRPAGAGRYTIELAKRSSGATTSSGVLSRRDDAERWSDGRRSARARRPVGWPPHRGAAPPASRGSKSGFLVSSTISARPSTTAPITRCPSGPGSRGRHRP